MLGRISRLLQRVMTPDGPLRGPILALLTVLALWVLYRLCTRILKRHMQRKAYKQENIQNFLFIWRYAWFGVAVVMAVIGLSGSIGALGISAAFLGMIMGWSLQAPVTGIAAWLLIILKRPFKIGDRIIVSGIVGDVVDINLTHIILNQAGGTVAGEEKSGRGVMIPNATLFQQIIYNFNFETNRLLDEVPVLITYESDYDQAERILLESAKEIAKDTIRESGQEPYVRAELADSGIRLRLRYQTLAMERQRISSEIVYQIIKKFNQTDKVEFAYPHTEVLYRPKNPSETGK